MDLVCDVYYDFVSFPFGILGQMWFLIVSIPDLCCLSCFNEKAGYRISLKTDPWGTQDYLVQIILVSEYSSSKKLVECARV